MLTWLLNLSVCKIPFGRISLNQKYRRHGHSVQYTLFFYKNNNTSTVLFYTIKVATKVFAFITILTLPGKSLRKPCISPVYVSVENMFERLLQNKRRSPRHTSANHEQVFVLKLVYFGHALMLYFLTVRSLKKSMTLLVGSINRHFFFCVTSETCVCCILEIRKES